MYLVKSPLLLKWFYSSLTWNKPRSQKIVYLTFDDGPIPNVTDFVLNTLKSQNALATFFCIGDNIIKHTSVFERIKEEGHAIGNHTFNHLKGWKTDNQTYLDNFIKCQNLTLTNLFRPPYGRIKKSQIKSLTSAYNATINSSTQNFSSPDNSQLQIIMWDVLSGDFDLKLSPEKCYQNVIKNARNGSIIVFHDSLKAFDRLQYALPKALQYLKEQGYQFGTL
jgi:peptidoglycan/xylan/chitin deacetylase (PgdA/CDA1 family)